MPRQNAPASAPFPAEKEERAREQEQSAEPGQDPPPEGRKKIVHDGFSHGGQAQDS
jgi:hypothetical protein